MNGFLKVWEYKGFLLTGTLVTLEMAIGATIIGIILGTVLGLFRISNNKLLRGISGFYLWIIRGTPMLLQIIFVYVGIPQIYKILTGNVVFFDPVIAGIVGIGFNSGAYVAEIVRAGIQSVNKGQMEAARSLGLTHGQAMRYVILPQAFYTIVPALGNELIVLLKDTSLVSAIGARDLMNSARIMGAKYYQYAEFLAGAAVIYLVLTFCISQLVNYVERRFKTVD